MKTIPIYLVLLGSVIFLGLAYFPAIFLDSTFVEYNRLPVDAIPNSKLYTSVKKAPKVRYSLTPHDGSPTRDSWNAPGQYHPVLQYQSDSLNKGEWPWWDPHTGLGVPLFAFGHEMLFNPLALAFYWVNPKWWDMIYLAMMVGMSCFIFQFLRLFEVSLLIAIPLAIASPLIGSIPLATGYGGETWAFCLFPYSLLVTEKFVRSPNPWNIAGIGLSIYLLFTTGMPEATLALLTFVWIYFLFRVIELKRPLFPHVFLWFAVFLAGALLTSPQWVHLLHNFSVGQPHRSNVGHFYLAIDALLGWAIRYVGGWPGLDIHPDWDKISQVGHLGMIGVLSLFGLFLYRRKIHWGSHLFWIWPLIYILKNYGFIPWIAEGVGRIPLYEGMYFYRYFAPTLQICQVMLVGIFFNFLLQQKRPTLQSFSRWVFWITLLIVGLGLWDVSWRADFEIKTAGWKLASRWVGLSLLFGMGAAAFLRFSKSMTLAVLGLCGILLFESWQGVPRRNYSPRLNPYEETGYVAFLNGQNGVFRATSLENFLFSRNNMAVGISDIKYNLAMIPAQMDRFFSVMKSNNQLLEIDWKGKPELFHQALGGVNVRYLIQRSPERSQSQKIAELLPMDRWHKIYSDSFAEVFENRDALPRAFFAHKLDWFTEAELSAYTIETFAEDVTKASVAVTKKPDWVNEFSVTERDPSAQIDEVRQDTGSRFEVRYTSKTPQFLVISNTFYPGWKAFVDGKPMALYRTNLTMQGIFVPAETHLVTLEYEPIYWGQTRIAAILGLLLFLGICFFSRKSSVASR